VWAWRCRISSPLACGLAATVPSVVIGYLKVGCRLAGVAAVIAPLIRESRLWQDEDPATRALLRPRPAQALEALGYWVDRRQRLPFYRLGARREAGEMIRAWQGRVIRDVPGAPLEALTSGRVITVGGKVARYHAGRWLARLCRGALAGAMMLALTIWLLAR